MNCEQCGGESVESACGTCTFLQAEEASHREGVRVARERVATERQRSDDTVGHRSHHHRALSEMFHFQAEAFEARADGFRAELDARKSKAAA